MQINETTNLPPMSSFWALGWNLTLGPLDHRSGRSS
jgi:hypothetical protein